MAKTVAITGPFVAGGVANLLARQPANFVVTLTSASTDSALQLTSLYINESTESDAAISQPTIAAPNSFPGGFPTLAAGGSLSYPFSVDFASPMVSGLSPQNPGGAAPGQKAMEPDALFTLQVQAGFSDGTVVTVSQMYEVTPDMAIFPRPEGGAAFFQQGSNTNLIAAIA